MTRFRKLLSSVMIIIGVACAVASANRFFVASNHFKHVAETDERIVADIRALLENHFDNLRESDEIYARYGRFQKLDDWKWIRPQYSWQLVERIDFTTIAKFEKAQLQISLGIDRGDVAEINRLELSPASSWLQKNKEELKLIDDEFWAVGDGGTRTPSRVEGWALHPDFIYE